MNKTLAPVAALLIGVSILLCGQGLQGTLLPVRAALEDFSTVSIGIMGATYFFGFTIGCLQGGELVRRVGHVRVFLAMSAIASASPLIHGLILQPVAWGALRWITGFCFAVLYIVIESWLNDRSTNENRGVVFSIYTIITLTVLAAGQMMTLMYDPSGFELFIIASVLVSLSAVPVALSTSPSPEQPQTVTIDMRWLYRVSPSGVIGCLTAGLANGSFWALGPVFATQVGDDVSLAAWFMTSAVLGGAIGQWPVGLLSDKLGRRKMLVAVSSLGAVVGVLLFVFAGALDFVSANLLAALWGLLAFPLYTIAVAYTNDHAESSDYVKVSGGLLLMYGAGAIAGPFCASWLMTIGGNGGLFVFSAAVHLGLVTFVAFRFLRSRAVVKQQIAYTDALSATQTASRIYDEEVQQQLEEEDDLRNRSPSQEEIHPAH